MEKSKANAQFPSGFRPGRRALCALAVAAVLSGCQGEIAGGRPEARGENPIGGGRDDSAQPGGPNDPDRPGGPSGGADSPATGDEDMAAGGERDVSRVPLHRLNNTEYDNTVRDLLGVTSTPARGFIGDEKLHGFDNIASALGMTDAQLEQYWNAAGGLVEEVFADPALRDRVVICAGPDAACVTRIVEAFGLRAFRRPLLDAEVDRLVALQQEAVQLGEDFEGSLAHVVRSMLTSVDFLYRVELDPDPSSGTAHLLNGYEIASRLSYLVWSTMPDQLLFDAAASDELLELSGLQAELARMLEHPRSRQLVESFAGQWLGLRDLKSHQVDDGIFSQWNEDLRAAMVEEGFLYFDEFFSGKRAVSEFFTADVNFVTSELADLYGIERSSAPPDASARVTDASDERRGFLGLASFLTLTSYSYRTAPTLRGKWVLENLLCQEITPPPADVPVLDDEDQDESELESENVRIRLERHRTDPGCASCHKILDPIGLGLEHFDAVGAFRERYGNGDAIDASGELPDGTQFSGIEQLSSALSTDARFADCLSEKLLTYALSRELEESDEPYLEEIRADWESSDRSVGALLERIVLSDLFRYRRGEP